MGRLMFTDQHPPILGNIGKVPLEVTIFVIKGTHKTSHIREKSSANSLCSRLCGLFLLAFGCRCLRSSGGVGQTLLVSGNDVIVEALVELGDDVAPSGTRQRQRHRYSAADESPTVLTAALHCMITNTRGPTWTAQATLS